MASEIIPPHKEGIERAALHLHSGKLVAFPTETVYGLGADACLTDSVAKIFATKQRPSFNPLIIHIAYLEDGLALGKFNESARALAEAFWQSGRGGLTLVVPKTKTCPVSELALAGGSTIGLRLPAHAAALALLKESGLFIAAPSANPSSKLSPTTAEHVRDSFPNEDIFILDGGATQLGLESTVIGCLPSGDFLLRAGAIETEEIESLLGKKLSATEEGATKLSAGRLPLHYAPAATLRLNATEALEGEGYLAFGARARTQTEFNLSPSGNLTEAAHNFFAMLHAMDRLYNKIAVAPIPEQGLGIALNDRLRRAST